MSTAARLPQFPPLQNGDRLTRDEFERRYEATPHIKKAELIEGVVYMPSPVSLEFHGEPHCDMIGWLGVYRAHTPGVRCGDNSTVRLDLKNVPQPDGVLLINPKCGGQATIDNDGFVNGAPELSSEVSASSVSIDMNAKLHAYRRNGVQEYIVWRVFDKQVDWFSLVEGKYERLLPDAEGILKSNVFPGLWLDAAALVAGDLARVHQVLQRGLASPEHAAFVVKLVKARVSSP